MNETSEKDQKDNSFDMALHDLSLDEIITQLTNLKKMGCEKWKVRIIQSNEIQSCVGKILAAGSGDSGMVCLLPVPENIEQLNSFTAIMSMLVCDKAAAGQDCNKCSDLANCDHMKRFDANYRIMNELMKNSSIKEKHHEDC